MDRKNKEEEVETLGPLETLRSLYRTYVQLTQVIKENLGYGGATGKIRV